MARVEPRSRSGAAAAAAPPEDLRRSREAGFDLHQVKPVVWKELEGLLAGVRATRR